VFYQELNKANKKPAILKITKPYYKEYIPKSTLLEFPQPIVDLYNPDALSMTYTALLRESEKIVTDIKVQFFIHKCLNFLFHRLPQSRLVSWSKKQRNNHLVNCGLSTELVG